MRKLALAMLAATALAGCTVIGAVTGGAIGSSRNRAERERAQAAGKRIDPADQSVLPAVLVGAGLGLVIDLVLLSRVDFNRHSPNQ